MDKVIHFSGGSPSINGSQHRASAFAGEGSRLSDLLHLLSSTEAPGLAALVDEPILSRRLHEGDTLFHEGARADAIYFVRSGSFKTFCTAEDGYEQVLGFVGRAEVLGFDALCTNRHPNSAVAMEDSSVFGVPVRDLSALGRRVPAFDHALVLAVSRELAHRGDLANVMAAVAAEVRLARFLVQWSTRMAARGQSPRRFVLRMSRREMASHLGVAHETVSRGFRVLANAALVKVCNREVEILDMDGLKAFSCSTRRPIDEDAAASAGHSQHAALWSGAPATRHAEAA